VGFNLDTCKWVVWGHRNEYHTNQHVMAGFYRALQHMGKPSLWVDGDDGSVDFSNSLFLSINDVSIDYGNERPQYSIPRRDDCFYAIYNGGDPRCRKYFAGLLQLAYACIYHARSTEPYRVDLSENATWLPPHGLEMRWATDLLPHEIQALKPDRVFRSESRVINWVGTYNHSHNGGTLTPFIDECRRNGIDFRAIGGSSTPHRPTMEEHIRLIQESYIAPTIPANDQMDGYAPCRIFKNISYGQYGVTNSKHVNAIFGDRLIFNPDSRQLFHTARERLPQVPLKDLHDLMDEVAAKHTYLNRIDDIEKAVRLTLGG
jgi:hypothetical protein